MRKEGMKMKKILLSSVLLLGALWAGAAPVELVKDGKAVVEIVLAKDANQGMKLAAEDLRFYLGKISGAELKIVNSPTPDVKNQIYVGESEFTRKLGFTPAKFDNSGFEIVAKDNYVILSGIDRIRVNSPWDLKKWQDFCGEKFTYTQFGFGVGVKGTPCTPLGINYEDDTGTWYAGSELLEQLGVRFYAPYENGTVIPEMKDVSVAEQHLKSEAAFATRGWCYYNAMRSDKDGIAWLKRLKNGCNYLTFGGHTTCAIFASKEQQELHPEYLACDSDGKPYSGYPAGQGMPRFGNPDFRKASVILMNKLFEADPELTYVSLGQPDGGIKIDYRDIGLYGKEGDSMAQRIPNCYWDYTVFLAKELKKSHPNKFLMYMAYGDTKMLPTNMKSDDPDNIIMFFAQGYSAYNAIKCTAKVDRDERHKWVDAVKQKNQGAGKSLIWDYYLYYCSPSRPRYPVFFTESLQEEMKEYQPYASGKFSELQAEWQVNGTKQKDGFRIGAPAIMHLMIYWQNKLLWNPNIDRKAMLEEYYKLYFGPAAAEMKEFHEFAEAVWCRQESRSITQYLGFLKQADVDKYFEILARARAKAGKDTVYDKRIAAMEEAYQPVKTIFQNLERKGPDVPARNVPNDMPLDGDVAKSKYKDGWFELRDKMTGNVIQSNRTEVCIAMSEDKTALYVAAVCHENKMDKIKAAAKRNDDAGIFEDDVIEVYLNSPECSYFKIAVNPNGAVWDESTDVSIIARDTLPVLWNPGIKAVVKKYDDRWTLEMRIPTKDFGKTGPTKQYPWGIQVGRTRCVEGMEWSSLGTGPGPYAALTEWGNLWVK